jgi:hypothetical protein
VFNTIIVFVERAMEDCIEESDTTRDDRIVSKGDTLQDRQQDEQRYISPSIAFLL